MEGAGTGVQEGATLDMNALLELIDKRFDAKIAEKMKAEKEAAEKKGHEIIDKGGAVLAKALDAAAPEVKKDYGIEEERGLKLARYMRLHALGKGNFDRMKAINEEWSKSYKYGFSDQVTKALSAGVPGGAAELVPPGYVAEVIELLRAATVMRQLGARVIPMPAGTITMPKQTAAANAEYVGENQGQNASEEQTGNITLSAKKLRITVPVSNDLLRFAAVDADAFVRDDMVETMRIKEDVTFLRSEGNEFAPRGIRYWAHADNQVAANGTVNLANVSVDLGLAILGLVEANVPMTRPSWIMAPRSWHYLMTVQDGNGNFVFRPEMLGGRLWGWPFRMTTSVPWNLGGGSNESEVYFLDAAQVLIGDVHGLEVEASTEASYKNSSGTLVSAFDLDQMVLRGIQRHDLAVRHDKAIFVLTAVKWGV